MIVRQADTSWFPKAVYLVLISIMASQAYKNKNLMISELAWLAPLTLFTDIISCELASKVGSRFAQVPSWKLAREISSKAKFCLQNLRSTLDSLKESLNTPMNGVFIPQHSETVPYPALPTTQLATLTRS